MIQRILILLIIFSFYINTNAQKGKQDIQLLAYNIGFNGVTAGIGSIIYKDKNQKWVECFAKGFYQGCLGGLFIYSGKKLIFELNNQKNDLYGWPSKILYYAGASIAENAALNKKFGKYWNIDIWAFRCDFSFGENSYFKARLMVSSIYSAVYLLPKANFDWRRSAMTGTLIFSTNSMINGHYGIAPVKAVGISTYFDNIPGYNEYYVISHELIHTYQFREYQIFNSWLKPFEEKVPKKIKNIFINYLYLDISYMPVFYYLQGGEHNSQYYFKNFYEFEAEHFSTNTFVPLKRF